MLNKMKVKAIAGILVVFVLGALVGALGTTAFVVRKMRQFALEGTHERQTWAMRRLHRQLRLTNAQKPEVQKILKQAEEEVHDLLQDSLAEFIDIVRRRNARLKPLLTPEQQQKLDEMFERMQRHWPVSSPSDEKPSQ